MAIERNVSRQDRDYFSKQHEGYTKIPNNILEALTRIRISGEEGQCLWLILRKTYGWHKQEDWISNSQFVKMTGINKQNVNRAIQKLAKKNMVIKKDYNNRSVYSLQQDVQKWEASSKKITKSVIQNDYASNQKRLEAVIQNDEHKSIITKETITKENPSDFEKALGVTIEGVIKTID